MITIYIWKTSLKKCSQKLFKNVIREDLGACTFSIVLKRRYRSFSIYLITNIVAKVVLRTKVDYLNNTKSLESLLRSLSRKVNMKEVKPNRFNIELGI